VKQVLSVDESPEADGMITMRRFAGEDARGYGRRHSSTREVAPAERSSLSSS
jgi:hypothetical protein